MLIGGIQGGLNLKHGRLLIMPVGIENLATGLHRFKCSETQDRQDVIDQREAERFDMQKQQFADNQTANQLSMKTNQFQLGRKAQAEAEEKNFTRKRGITFANKWEGLRVLLRWAMTKKVITL